jgi:hypothetical protein
MIQHATVYRREDGYYFHANSQTTAGVWIASEPFLRLSCMASVEEKGDAVTLCVAGSRSGVRHPQQNEWSAVFAPMLALAGCKSWKSFEQNSECCQCEAENGFLTFIPQRLIAPDQGFEPIPGSQIVRHLDSKADEIGRTLETAFSAEIGPVQ